MKYASVLFLALIFVPLGAVCAGELVLVDNGKGRAEIVISETPLRTVRLAAHELQTYVEKISGAKLPISFSPTPGVPVQIYVGRSSYTDALDISTDGLNEGAYRIVSGENRLVLIGEDTECTP
ncbi:MAG: hypothetical protein O3A29_20790, partial [Planctomycetota bacterium]|nr:hypothetical protein [Planctomycetota bacterium]